MNLPEDITISNYFVKDIHLDHLQQWWNTCPASHITLNDREWYVLNLIGNPMTGSNNCLLVDEEGNECHHAIPHFKQAYQSLIKIQRYYDE